MDFKLKNLLIFMMLVVHTESLTPSFVFTKSLTASFLGKGDKPAFVGPGVEGFKDLSHISFNDENIDNQFSSNPEKASWKVEDLVSVNSAGNVPLSSKAAQDALQKYRKRSSKRSEKASQIKASQIKPSQTGCLSFLFNKKD